MAGFLSPGLGFSSTIGAAITGAARQANTMLDEQRKQERQDDILNDAWAHDFDTNSKKYNDLQRQQKQLSDVRNTFVSLAGGSQQAADMALNAYQARPGDYAKIVNSLQETASKGQGMKDPDGYKSPFEENQNRQLQDQRGRLESNYNRLNPRNRGLVTMPDAPGGGNSQGGDYGGGAPTQPQGSTMPPGNTRMVGQNPTQGNVQIGQPQMGTPSMAMPTKPPGGSVPSMIPPNNGMMVGQPQRDIPGSGGQSATPGAQSFNPATPMNPSSNVPADPNRPTPAYGKPDVPAPSPDQGGDNSIPPVPQGQSPNTQYQAPQVQPPQQVAQNSGPNVMFPSFARTGNAANQEIARDRLDEEKRFHTWQMGQKPPGPDAIVDLDIRKQDTLKYLQEPKTGLQARMAGMQDLRAQAQDLNSLQGLINRGFKSNSVQEIYDTFNGLTTATMGLDLSKFGVANTYADATELKKAIANTVIDRLKTLHFGRITNYEAQTVKDGLINNKNDPNTNVKIGLALQKVINAQYNQTAQEHNIVYGQSAQGNMMDRVTKARQFVNSVAQDSGPEKPAWMQVNGNATDAAKQVGAIPNGQWFEDKSNGTMYIKNQNGQLKRAGDNING